MASFCRQCSLDTFGKDFEDFADITKPIDELFDLYAVVLCEGCGAIQVNHRGECISKDCLERKSPHYSPNHFAPRLGIQPASKLGF